MNYSFKPSLEFVMTNDALTKKLFSGKYIVKGKEKIHLPVMECRKKKLMSDCRVTNTSEKAITLNEFDRAVFSAAISEMSAGNDFTTAAVIYRDLGGSKTHSVPSEMKAAIEASLNKLSSLDIFLDMSTAAQKTSYLVEGNAIARADEEVKNAYSGVILSKGSGKLTSNGQKLDVVKLKDSVVYKVAAMKGQVLRVDCDLMKVPLRNTSRVIAIKHYVIRRVMEIIGSAKSSKAVMRLQPIITFADLFEHCGFTKLTRFQRQDVKDIIVAIFEHLKSLAIIAGYELKIDKVNKLIAITFEFSRSAD